MITGKDISQVLLLKLKLGRSRLHQNERLAQIGHKGQLPLGFNLNFVDFVALIVDLAMQPVDHCLLGIQLGLELSN